MDYCSNTLIFVSRLIAPKWVYFVHETPRSVLHRSIARVDFDLSLMALRKCSSYRFPLLLFHSPLFIFAYCVVYRTYTTTCTLFRWSLVRADIDLSPMVLWKMLFLSLLVVALSKPPPHLHSFYCNSFDLALLSRDGRWRPSRKEIQDGAHQWDRRGGAAQLLMK